MNSWPVIRGSPAGAAIMVNVSDVAAMGGRPIAVVDAVWAAKQRRCATGPDGYARSVRCFRRADRRWAQPMHAPIAANCRWRFSAARSGSSPRSMRGRATAWSAAIDLRGPPTASRFSNWEGRKPMLPPRGCARISMCCQPFPNPDWRWPPRTFPRAGLVGTALMLAECSGVGAVVEVASVPKPGGCAARSLAADLPEFRLSPGGAVPETCPTVLARFGEPRHCGSRLSERSRRSAVSKSSMTVLPKPYGILPRSRSSAASR